MEDRTFKSSGGSFFSGRKKFAKCLSTYVDKWNCISPYDGATCRLTAQEYYQVVEEGTFFNSTNAFRTYFKMIFILDDNQERWGLDEDLFDMDDQYASRNEIEAKKNKKEPAVPCHKEDEVESETDYDDLDDEEDLDNDDFMEEVKPVPVVKNKTYVVPRKVEQIKTPASIVAPKVETDVLSLVKQRTLYGREYNYQLKNLSPDFLTSPNLISFLEESSDENMLIVGRMNLFHLYFILNNKICCYKVEKNVKELEVEFILQNQRTWLETDLLGLGSETMVILSSQQSQLEKLKELEFELFKK